MEKNMAFLWLRYFVNDHKNNTTSFKSSPFMLLFALGLCVFSLIDFSVLPLSWLSIPSQEICRGQQAATCWRTARWPLAGYWIAIADETYIQ